MVLTTLGLLTYFTASEGPEWYCDSFISTGSQVVKEGPSSITDVTGFALNATWHEYQRPPAETQKSVVQTKGVYDTDQPEWQVEVSPLGDSGTFSVPFPAPNPFLLGANQRAFWKYRITYYHYAAEWSLRYPSDPSTKLKRATRASTIVDSITSETTFENGYLD